MSQQKAVILVGGPGTRLQPLTYDTPKSMVPLLNRPFMEHTIAYLKQAGIREVIVTLNYLPDVILGYFGDGRRSGVRLTYCLEETPLGTAGAVKNAEKYLDSTFFVLNGDVFTDLDLAAMLARHREKKAMATISLVQVDNPSAFGVVETDSKQRVKRFIEKPPPGQATTNWINAGTYILEPAVLRHVPADTHYMLERGLFPTLLERGEAVYGYPSRGYWIDMGTPAKYLSLNGDLLLAKAKSYLLSTHNKNVISCGQNVDIHHSAEILAPAVIGPDCRIKRGVHIQGPAVIGAGGDIDEGAVLEDVVLWDNVSIGAGAKVRRCILGSRVRIEAGKQISNNIVTVAGAVPLSKQTE